MSWSPLILSLAKGALEYATVSAPERAIARERLAGLGGPPRWGKKKKGRKDKGKPKPKPGG